MLAIVINACVIEDGTLIIIKQNILCEDNEVHNM